MIEGRFVRLKWINESGEPFLSAPVAADCLDGMEKITVKWRGCHLQTEGNLSTAKLMIILRKFLRTLK